MENREENIGKMVIRLKVLESKIQKLETQTDGVIHDLESEFQQQIKKLQHKKILAQQKLSEIKQADQLG